jgi:hypothetical protein
MQVLSSSAFPVGIFLPDRVMNLPGQCRLLSNNPVFFCFEVMRLKRNKATAVSRFANAALARALFELFS